MIKQSYGKDVNSCDYAEYCIEEKIGISIIYAYEDSDTFYPAKLLKHGISCLCFASKELIGKGEKIYILTQDFPIEDTKPRIYEGCFAQVGRCEKIIEDQKRSLYLIRATIANSKATIMDANKFKFANSQ
jgi:hypothetical protein